LIWYHRATSVLSLGIEQVLNDVEG